MLLNQINLENSLIATAYHEAGHVAIALHFCHKFLYVTVNNFDDAEVRFYKRKVFDKLNKKLPLLKRERQFLVQDIQVTLAGSVAEGKFRGLENPLIRAFTPDDDHVGEIIEHICNDYPLSFIKDEGFFNQDELDTQYYEDYLIKKTNQLINTPALWNFISSLANLLLKKKKLSYSECLQLYNTFRK